MDHIVSRLLTLIGIASIILALGIVVTGPGTRFGLWDYTTGLKVLQALAVPVLVGAILSATGFVATFYFDRTLTFLMMIATVLSGVTAAVPIKMLSAVKANPFIHDITTDFENPPQIVTAADLPRDNSPEYLGDGKVPNSELTVREAQQKAFPDITSKRLELTRDEVESRVRTVFSEMKIEILNETQVDSTLIIEGVYTSTWYGFADDFIVRLTSQGEGTLIDVRSKSRVGSSDLGENARRVREFFEKLGV